MDVPSPAETVTETAGHVARPSFGRRIREHLVTTSHDWLAVRAVDYRSVCLGAMQITRKSCEVFGRRLATARLSARGSARSSFGISDRGAQENDVSLVRSHPGVAGHVDGGTAPGARKNFC